MRKLKEFELFKKFSDSTLSKLQNMTTEKIYAEEDFIFNEGDPGDALYIVAEGEVAIRRLIDKSSGRMKTIAVIERDDFFGEMAIFDDRARSATAVASRQSSILMLRKEDLWKTIYEEPETAVTKLLGMNRVMADRLRIANQNFITTYEIGQIVTRVKNITDLLDMALEQLVSAVEKSDAGFFALFDEFSEDFRISSIKGDEGKKIIEQEILGDDSLVKDILENKETIYIENTNNTEKYPDLSEKSYNGKSALVSPVMLDEKIIGIIYMLSYKEFNAFNQANRLLVGTVASQLSTAIMELKNKEEEENRKKLMEKRYQY